MAWSTRRSTPSTRIPAATWCKKLYPDRYVFAAVDSSLQYYFSGKAGLKSPLLAQRASRYRPQLAQVKPGNDVVQPRVRKAFPDTAYWSPSIHTDAAGHAHVTLTFPDSLTTWRTTVHAITLDSRAGSAINRVLVRKNIIVRMGTPRFLRQGDEVTIPVIVHNYLDQAKQVQLSLDINGLDPVSGAAAISQRAQQRRRHCAVAGEGIAHRHRPSAGQSAHQ